ncbi:hypothetical protein [Streptomyces atratus]|nr:hypothetical protein [Streptomyces atratus]
MSREKVIPLVQRLMEADTATEAEMDDILDALQRCLACPHISDYIFWSSAPDLMAEKVVDRAMAYKAIAL